MDNPRSAAHMSRRQHYSSESRLDQLRTHPNASYNPSKEPSTEISHEKIIATVLQSYSPVSRGRTPGTPETASRSSTRQSGSTIPYSSDWTPLSSEDAEGEFISHAGLLPLATLGRRSSSWGPKVSGKSHRIRQLPSSSGISSASSATASIASPRPHEQRPSGVHVESLLIGNDSTPIDLFAFARARVDNLQYRQQSGKESTEENLRRRTLRLVFGWDQDIEELIRDEVNHHPPNSMNAIILSKWLGDADADIMGSVYASSSRDPSDWMFMALNQMNGQTMTKEAGHNLTRRMLKKGDIHAAVSILIGLGEYQDAVDMYISHFHYMEAILLTCLKFPNNWKRQSDLVRRWGEYVMMPSRQLLAIRCFSCISTEPADSWASLNAEMTALLTKYTEKLRMGSSSPSTTTHAESFVEPSVTKSSVLTSPPQPTKEAMAQDLTLKLITSFPTPEVSEQDASRQGFSAIEPPVKNQRPLAQNSAVSSRYESQPSEPESTLWSHEFSRQRLSSIGEASLPNTPQDDQFRSQVQPFSLNEGAHQIMSGGDSLASQTLPPKKDLCSQQLRGLNSGPRKDTPHPDSENPYSTRDEILKASTKEESDRSGLKELKLRGLRLQPSTTSEDTHADKGSDVPPLTTTASASVSIPKSPLSDTNTSWKIDQFIQSLNPAAIPSPELSQGRREKEPPRRRGGRQQSVERGRRHNRYPMSQKTLSSTASDSSSDDSSNPSIRNTRTLGPRDSSLLKKSKKSASTTRQLRFKDSTIRSGSEPAHRRRTPEINQSQHRRAVSQDKGTPARRYGWIDYKGHVNDLETKPVRNERAVKDQTNPRQRPVRRLQPSDIQIPHEDKLHGIGLLISEETGADGNRVHPAMLNHFPTQVPRMPRVDKQQPQQPLDINGFQVPVSVNIPTDRTHRGQSSERHHFRSDSSLNVGETPQSAQTVFAAADDRLSDVASTTESMSTINIFPRPSSGHSSISEPPARRFDIPMHPAFHADIRPTKTGPAIPTRRDPSQGRRTTQGEAWTLLDAAEEQFNAEPTSASKTPTSAHRSARSVNDGFGHKFRAMADRVRSRSPSRGRGADKKRPLDNNLTTTTPDGHPNTNVFKSMADRVRSTSRGKRDVEPYYPTEHPPYETELPPIRAQEMPAPA